MTRKEFVVKTSKVAGGILLCPAIISSLTSCSDPSSSLNTSCSVNEDGLMASCNFHGAQFNTDGCPVSGPAEEGLTQYEHNSLENNVLTIINGSETESIDISQEGNGALLDVGGSIIYSSQIANRLLIYRKSNNEFNIFSAVCPHANGDIGLFI